MRPPALTELGIARVMYLWDLDKYAEHIEVVMYTNYLLSIRDWEISQDLDRMCGTDVNTALKISEMR